MDIATATYVKKTIGNSNKSRTPDDSVFNNLIERVGEDNKIKIVDFLNLFYYFIVCYSRFWLRRHANWDAKWVKIHGGSFNYALASELQSKDMLLRIQEQLNVYRKNYNNTKKACRNDIALARTKYLTEERVAEMMDFFTESLYDMVNCISKPVIFVSTDIKANLYKYKDIKSKTRATIPGKSSKINYAALQAILNDTSAITSKSTNMIEVTFFGSNATH